MNIAIIPARGGSKRIKGKNIKNFLGKPIISYAIKCAKATKIFDKIIVSSDNKEIIKTANKFDDTYHDAGQFYWGRVNTWLNNKSLLNNDAYAFKLPQLRVQDIDYLEDWKITEKLFKLKYK